MKLIDIINNVINTEDNQNSINTSSLYEEILENSWPSLKDNAEVEIKSTIKEYWVQYWYCTDTYVGFSVMFFNDKPVAYISQKGRKWDREYYWLSKEAYNEVSNYLRSFIVIEENNNITILSEENKQENIGEFYNLEFAEQILDKKVYYQDKLCDVISSYPDQLNADGTINWKLPNTNNILIKDENGNEIKVNIKEVKIRYHVADNVKHETPKPNYSVGEKFIYTLPSYGFSERRKAEIKPFEAEIISIDNSLGYNIYTIKFYIDNKDLPESARWNTLETTEGNMKKI